MRKLHQYGLVAAAAFVVHLVLVVAYVASPRFGGDPSALLCVARARLADPPYRQVRIGFPTDGYDGQFYYVLAQAPARRHDSVHIDKPAYRHLRILYPLLAWLSTGGDPHRLLWAMPAINLFAVAALAGLGAYWAARWGRSPWWGLLLPLAVNMAAPTLRNLTDPLSTLTVMVLLTVWLCDGSARWLALAGTLAALAREQNLAVIAFLGMLAMGRRDSARTVAMLLAVGLWSGWVVILWRMYDDSPFVFGNFGPPLAAMIRRLTEAAPGHSPSWMQVAAVSALAIEMIACVFLMPRWRPAAATMLLGWAGTALAAMGSWAIWIDPHAYLRVFPWVPLALWLAAIQSGRRWPFILTLPLLPWPILVVAHAWR